MIHTFEVIRNDPKLHALLLGYAARKRETPDAEWHDRIMELAGCDEAALGKLHGLLLASGWIETRVHGEAFRKAGVLESCYRITPDGSAALRLAGPAAELPDEESEQIL